MSNLLVVGAINTDLIAFVERAPLAGETLAGGHFEQHGGGKAANQAVSAARSGTNVSLLSAVGGDDFGRARLQALAGEGIDINSVSRIKDVSSGVAIIIVESTGENRICDLPGARDRMTPERVQQAYQQAKPAAILSANELSYECHETIFQRATDEQIPVWFNTAPFSEECRKLLPFVDTLIANRGEAEDILDAREDGFSVEQLASGLRGLGVQRVILALGGDGVRGFDADGDYSIPAESGNVVDTTGAGDTFCGAWASEMLRGATFEDALRYANRAASISVTRRGAQSSIPTRQEIES